MKPLFAAPTVVAVAAIALSSCFLLVSSGIRREVPEGARGAAAAMLERDERIVAAWDGSVAQDGSLLALVTDRHVMKRDGEHITRVLLTEVSTIVVNEDDGAVDVYVGSAAAMSLPLRSSDERKAFARWIQTEVQRAKREGMPPIG